MRCKYQLRWFSSKQVFWVLVWTSLVSCLCNSSSQILNQTVSTIHLSIPSFWLAKFPLLVVVLSIPLSVYLADAKWGVYEVLKVGMVLLFIHTVLNCWLLVIGNLFWNNQVLTWIQFCSFSSVFVIGCTS